MAHARALLASITRAGVTDYIEADLRDPARILKEAAETLDFRQPIALLLVAVLHFIPDADDPYGVVARLVAGLPAGSYLVVSHATSEDVSEEVTARAAVGSAPVWLRSREDIARFFDGLDLLPPGLVSTVQWRAEYETQPRPTAAEVATYCGIGWIP